VLRHRAAVVLTIWTVLVWTTRFGTIWSDGDLDTAGKLGRTALALTFTLLAAGVAVALWRRADAALGWLVVALAGWTTAVWIVRSVGIAAGDHDTGFKVVHLILAVVSIGLSAWAVRSLGSVSPLSPERQQGSREPSATG
jgi:hypothetical protein